MRFIRGRGVRFIRGRGVRFIRGRGGPAALSRCRSRVMAYRNLSQFMDDLRRQTTLCVGIGAAPPNFALEVTYFAQIKESRLTSPPN